MKNKILFLAFILAFMVVRVNAECASGFKEINYDANGGKFEISTDCVILSITKSTPTRKGYAFLGWSTSKSHEVTHNPGDSANFESGTTLYAVWSKGVKLTFNPNGGKTSKKSKTVASGVAYGNLPTASKKGYEFLGWFTKKSDGVQITPETIVEKEKNFTVYAHYRKITYTITYELNGGVNNGKNKTAYTITNKFKLYNPSREGYIFKGWYKKSNYKGKVTNVKKGTTGNKTYYAKWAAIKYNIKYVGNGSKKGSTKTQKNLKYNVTYNLKNNWFSKKGYDFVGWNTKKDGSGTHFDNGQSVINLKNKNGKTITLYAQWAKESRVYTISYELYGGINSIVAPETYDGTETITLPVPTRKGYDFKGWYEEETFIHKVTTINKGSSGNKKLYAYWMENHDDKIYSITYELNGGTNPSNAPSNYLIGTSVTLPTPSRNGYKFEGWYKDRYFNNRIYSIEKTQSGNYVVYAKWSIEERPGIYAINYILNGGTNPSAAPYEYDQNVGVTLPTPTREKSTFLGWYLEGTDTKVNSFNAGTTGAKTVYAKWSFNDKRSYNYKFYRDFGSNTYNNKNELKLILYNILNNGAFDTMINCSYSNCVNDFVEMMNDETQNEITSIVNYVNPFNSYKTIRYSYNTASSSIMLSFEDKYSELDRYYINNAIDKALNSINVSSMSNRDKVKWAHDYLVTRNTYDLQAAAQNDLSSRAFSAYGALIENKAVCQGYTEAMALFLDRFNIPNLSVSSDNHIWNLVFLDGQWLHVDSTWDDPVTTSGIPVLRYDYFLKTSTELKNIDANNTQKHIYVQSNYLETTTN